MSRLRFANVVMTIFAKWWLLVPLLTVTGAATAFLKEIGQTNFTWSRIAVGAAWGTCLGLLSIPLSMPKARSIFAHLLAAPLVSLTLVVTGILMGWTLESIALAGAIGALIGLIARWWGPYATLS